MLPENRVVLRLAAVITAAGLVFAHIAEDVVTRDPLTKWDAELNRWLYDSASAPVTRFFELATQLGGGLLLLAAATSAAFALTRHGRRAEARLVVAAFGLSFILTHALKLAFERPRPPLHDAAVSLQTFSFPSGHASVSAAVYGALAFVLARRMAASGRIAVALTAGTLIGLVAASRVYLGAHYLSDVLAGLALGFGVLAVCLLVLAAAETRSAPPPAR